jgi:hypothetical protein
MIFLTGGRLVEILPFGYQHKENHERNSDDANTAYD